MSRVQIHIYQNNIKISTTIITIDSSAWESDLSFWDLGVGRCHRESFVGLKEVGSRSKLII